jgi:hypothetical protein
MLTTSGRDEILALYATGHYVGLISAETDWRAGSVTELSYSGYARLALALDAAANGSPATFRRRANSGQLTFAAVAGGAVAPLLYGVWDALTVGTLKAIGPFSADVPVVASVVDTTADDFVAVAHGLVADQRVYLLASAGMPMPTGVVDDTLYYIGTVADADHFTLSTTASNANPVAITTLGAVQVIPTAATTVNNDESPQIAIGGVLLAI